MAQQILDVSTPNSGLGDALRDASIKSNDNFTELYENKVNAVVGKDLSDNNLTNELITKINDLEALAQVNVQSNWNENDVEADAFIQNKPTQLFASLGYFDYADLATQTTPITVAPNTQTLLTNDTLGSGTDISQPPFAVSTVYDADTDSFDFSQLSIGDTVDIRVHVKVTTSANNQLYHIDLKAGISSASEFENRIFSQYVKTASEDEQTFVTTFYIGSNDIKDNLCKLFIESTQSCTVKILGWFVRVFRKSINVVELSDTIPLSDVLVNGNTTGGTNISISNGDAVILDNGANLKKGTTDAGLGGSKGIALRCAVDYELKWEAGRLYVMGGDGFTIREVSHNFTTTPSSLDDITKGFIVGSRWILDNGDVYLCNDPDEGSALWELQSAGVPDATTMAKGIVKLAGDLGGTANLPTVPELANKANDSAVVHNTGAETIAGEKTFEDRIIIKSDSSLLLASDNYVSGSVGNILFFDNNSINNYNSINSRLNGGTSNANLILQTSGNGNVGIGTETPSVKLEVNGSILATNLSGTNTGDQNLSGYALLNSPTFTGTVILPSTTSIGDVSNTEISYLDGVTSAIQTQLNGKLTSANWVDYSATSTIVGFASFTTKIIRYSIVGKTVNVLIYINGISNSANFSITLNNNASANYTIASYAGGLFAQSAVSGQGFVTIPISSSNIFNFGYWNTANATTATWTTTGAKNIRGFFSYEID